MRKIINLCIFSLSLGLCSTDVLYAEMANLPNTQNEAQTLLADSLGNAQAPRQRIPAPPRLRATSYILTDMNSGRILAQKDAQKRIEPASLTKMMTLYLTFEAIKAGQISLDDKVVISKRAWEMGGSRMFLKLGTHVKVRDLIRGIIVDSGNDACVALAEHIAGTEKEFANLMNQQAKLLGMSGSHFTDSTGLPNPAHYTTARDLAILSRALIQHYPEHYHNFSEKWFTYNKIKQPNRNRLLWRYKYADGIKTGHTKSAGYCLASSAKKDDMRLIAIVMGTPTDEARATSSQQLLNYGFRFFETHKIYNAGQAITEKRVWKGEQKMLPFGITDTLYLTVPRGQYKNLQITAQVPADLEAPIHKGSTYGTLRITLDGKPLAERPLIALGDDRLAGAWHRMVDHIGLAAQKLFHGDSDEQG